MQVKGKVAIVEQEPFILSATVQENITFGFEGQTLAGTLALPDGEGPFPVAIFIHGDGPQDRFSNV